jgi:hypothetical protein
MNLPRSEVAQIVKQITNISDQLEMAIKNAHERIIGDRKVANKDKILSLYEEDIHVIVRKKDGANVEFGNTLFLAEQSDGLIIDWKLYQKQAPHDTGMLKDSYNRNKDHVGVELELMASDRGFDSKDNRDFLEEHTVFNALCPRDPNLLKKRLKEDKFRQAQKRRSQREARNSILMHCFCGSPMKQKGFDNRESHLAQSILSHNLWVLARLRIKQIEEIAQAA